MTEKKDPSVENTLLEILGKKMLGNSMQNSKEMGMKAGQFAETAFRMLADSIQEYAIKNGLDPLPDTAGVHVREDPVYGNTTWGGKVYAHFSLDPTRFLIFCAYQQIELREKIASLKEEREQMRVRKDKILDLVRDCKDIDELGKLLDREELY